MVSTVSPAEDDQRVADAVRAWRTDVRSFARAAVERAALASPGRHTLEEALAQALGTALVGRGWRVATAESCTGGGLGAALTAIAGSSAWVEGGCITYSNAAKTALLGVPPDLITNCGAVSGPVVDAMARGACARLGADCAAAISGVAGPGGGSAHKPVGTVWLGCQAPGLAAPQCHELWFPGDRSAVRQGAVLAALTALLALCTD